MEDLPNKITAALNIAADVNLLTKDGHDFIEIKVLPSPLPILYKGKYFYRSGSTKQLLTGQALQAFLVSKLGNNWDAFHYTGFNARNIDAQALEHFIKQAVKVKRLAASVMDENQDFMLKKLKVFDGSNLSNTAVLMFSSAPDDWVLGAYIKIGYFESDADLLFQDEIHGPLLLQVDKAVELIYTKYLKAKVTYNGSYKLQRIDRYFVPQEALREAIINAVCHKHYQLGIPIQISVYPDKIYIANCGSLPGNWTIDTLLTKHASIPYNPNIAHLFYLAGYIENWGRGMEKICEACRAENIPLPVYTVNANDIMLKFTAPKELVISQNPPQLVSHEEFNDTPPLPITNNPALDRLVQQITLDPTVTSAKLAEKLQLSRQTVTFRIKQLKKMGILERVGSDRKGWWKIKTT